MESLREEQTAEESDRFVLYRKLRPLDFKADSKEKKKEILLLLQNPYYRLHVRCLARWGAVTMRETGTGRDRNPVLRRSNLSADAMILLSAISWVAIWNDTPIGRLTQFSPIAIGRFLGKRTKKEKKKDFGRSVMMMTTTTTTRTRLARFPSAELWLLIVRLFSPWAWLPVCVCVCVRHCVSLAEKQRLLILD